ncbi:hypothetical protein FRC02_002496 [Tulasnella sp. 418]|nr:hypothetical protein FRC02_002496 [Tulasnella sp. 418]
MAGGKPTTYMGLSNDRYHVLNNYYSLNSSVSLILETSTAEGLLGHGHLSTGVPPCALASSFFRRFPPYRSIRTNGCKPMPEGGQGQLASNFWKNVSYKKGTGKTGKAYVQLTGCINTKTLDRLNPSDGGGQYDSSGGAGGKGNPQGSKCTGYAHYVELIEPDVNRACIRCCQEYKDCPLDKGVSD